MNKCIFIGNITREPELKFIPSTGMAVCKISLAINEIVKGEKVAYFINCTAFGKTAEAVANYTDKGSKIGIESRLQTGSYENKQGVTVYTTDFIIDKVEFLSKKEEVIEEAFTPVDDDEDIPF